MEVYVEYAVIDNLVMDFLLIRFTLKIIKNRSKLIMQILSSSVGTFFAVVSPIYIKNGVLFFLLKILVGFLMPLIFAKYTSVKKYLISVFTFLSLTFLFGGVIIAVFTLADISYDNYFISNYDSVIPIGVTALISYLFARILFFGVKEFFKVKETSSFFRKCVICVGKVKIKTLGYIDSGNFLHDDKSGIPIIVSSKSFIKKIRESGAKLTYFKDLKTDTVNGDGNMKLFLVDKILIYNGYKVSIFENILLGEGHAENFMSGEFELLLNPSFL